MKNSMVILETGENSPILVMVPAGKYLLGDPITILNHFGMDKIQYLNISDEPIIQAINETNILVFPLEAQSGYLKTSHKKIIYTSHGLLGLIPSTLLEGHIELDLNKNCCMEIDFPYRSMCSSFKGIFKFGGILIDSTKILEDIS